MERHRQRAVGLDVAHGRPVGEPGAVRLRRGRDVGRRLGERVLRLGQPDPVERLAGRDGDRSARGSALPTSSDALMIRRRAMNSRVLAGRDHRRQPVQRRVRVVAAEALDERRDRVVVAVAGPVVGEDALLGGRLDVLEPRADAALGVADVLRLGERGRALEDVQRGAGVAAGERDEVLEAASIERDAAVRAEGAGESALLVGERPPDDRRDLVVGQGLEPPDPHPRQQRRVDLEVRVLGRRARSG